MITVDELFEEDFKPLWMQWQEEVEQMKLDSFKQALQTETNFKWRKAAQESEKRIVSKCTGFVYQNQRAIISPL